jgi:hypothetical protein
MLPEGVELVLRTNNSYMPCSYSMVFGVNIKACVCMGVSVRVSSSCMHVTVHST